MPGRREAPRRPPAPRGPAELRPEKWAWGLRREDFEEAYVRWLAVFGTTPARLAKGLRYHPRYKQWGNQKQLTGKRLVAEWVKMGLPIVPPKGQKLGLVKDEIFERAAVMDLYPLDYLVLVLKAVKGMELVPLPGMVKVGDYGKRIRKQHGRGERWT